tara:strand:+ start:236 stop:535 length:300 start_codon:yes stop_codon:yes gene_type:complete
MSIKKHKSYLAAKRRLKSAQNVQDRKTVSDWENPAKNIIRTNLVLNSKGVAFNVIPEGISTCVTVDRKLVFKYNLFDGEVSWREPSTKPPKGAFVISIK